MKRTMFLVTPHDTVNEVFVLREINESGRLDVKSEYRDLVCQRCRKVDERAALARGFRQLVTVRSKRPFVLSTDDLYLVDSRCERILRSIFPELIDFFPIPGTTFFVATPKLWIQPNENDAGYRFGDLRCLECHRSREVVWGKVPPKVGKASEIFAINIEGQLGARALWIVSEEAKNELKKASSQLTGMVIRPKDVDDEPPCDVE